MSKKSEKNNKNGGLATAAAFQLLQKHFYVKKCWQLKNKNIRFVYKQKKRIKKPFDRNSKGIISKVDFRNSTLDKLILYYWFVKVNREVVLFCNILFLENAKRIASKKQFSFLLLLNQRKIE